MIAVRANQIPTCRLLIRHRLRRFRIDMPKGDPLTRAPRPCSVKEQASASTPRARQVSHAPKMRGNTLANGPSSARTWQSGEHRRGLGFQPVHAAKKRQTGSLAYFFSQVVTTSAHANGAGSAAAY